MNIQPIRTKEDNDKALARINEIFNAEPNTAEHDELDILTTLVCAYEEQSIKIEAPDPVVAIKFRMEQQGLDDEDLVPFLGHRSRVSEILNRKRRLTIAMIRKLHNGLSIPLASLIKDYQLAK